MLDSCGKLKTETKIHKAWAPSQTDYARISEFFKSSPVDSMKKVQSGLRTTALERSKEPRMGN